MTHKALCETAVSSYRQVVWPKSAPRIAVVSSGNSFEIPFTVPKNGSFFLNIGTRAGADIPAAARVCLLQPGQSLGTDFASFTTNTIYNVSPVAIVLNSGLYRIVASDEIERVVVRHQTGGSVQFCLWTENRSGGQ